MGNAGHANLAVVTAHVGEADAEAEAGAAAALGGEEGLEDMRQDVGRDAGAGVADADLDHVDVRELVGVGANEREVARDVVLEALVAEHGLVLEEGHGIGDQPEKADPAEDEGAGARVVHQPMEGGGDALGAGDALFDFLAGVGVGGVFQLELEVREDAEQGIVDLVGGAEGELGEGGVLFVLGELGVELDFFLVEFLLFVEAAEQFGLGQIALALAFAGEVLRLFELAGECGEVVVVEAPEDKHHGGGGDGEGQEIVGERTVPGAEKGLGREQDGGGNEGDGTGRSLAGSVPNHPIITMRGDAGESCDAGHAGGCSRSRQAAARGMVRAGAGRFLASWLYLRTLGMTKGRCVLGRLEARSCNAGGYPPMWTMVREAGTKSGSPMWWRSSLWRTTPRMKSASSASVEPRRIWAWRSWSQTENRQVRILPSEVRRMRLQCPQKGLETGAMMPISPRPSSKR